MTRFEGARATGTAAAGSQSLQDISTPIQGSPEMGSPYGPRDGRNHNGVDIPCPIGTPCYAPVDGKIVYASTGGFSDGGMIHFEFQEDLGGIKKGDVIGWGHVYETIVESGNVTRGQKIATSGHADPHVHFVYIPGGNDGGSQIDGTADPGPVYSRLSKGEAPTGGGGGGGAGVAGGDGESIAKAAAFATFFQLTSLMEKQQSLTLTGEKSLMNDKPLMPFVQQLVEASLRNFQSMPNGNFFAFYPDYFGGFKHRTPYWEISDMEIIDGHIDLSDDELATHVYIVGSTAGSMQPSVGLVEELQSSGVVTIFNAFMLNFLNGNYAPGVTNPYEKNEPNKKVRKLEQKKLEKWMEETPTLGNKDNAVAFLKKYGARPHYEQMPMIRSPYYELFLAYQRFCLLWSKQFLTTFELTFMPELFPGGLIELKEHGIQCYVDEVSHNCSYEGGFTTSVNLSAPAALDDKARSDMNQGMVRAGILGSEASGG